MTNQPPDAIIQKGRSLWIIEFTAGFETNLEANTERKTQRYAQLIANLSQQYDSVKYIDISMSALGFFGKSCQHLSDLMDEFGVEHSVAESLFRKMIQDSNLDPGNIFHILYAG